MESARAAEDALLVRQVAQGDEKAFEALYDRYGARVYGLVLHILGDEMLAEEVTQDVFLKLWSRARFYLAGRGPFLPWLLTIAHHTAIDRLRLEGHRPVLSNATDAETVWDRLPDSGLPLEESRWRSLHLAVQSLPNEQRLVIELAYYQGLSQREIAEVLGWPLGTVKTRLRAAMENLRKAWLDEEAP